MWFDDYLQFLNFKRSTLSTTIRRYLHFDGNAMIRFPRPIQLDIGGSVTLEFIAPTTPLTQTLTLLSQSDVSSLVWLDPQYIGVPSNCRFALDSVDVVGVSVKLPSDGRTHTLEVWSGTPTELCTVGNLPSLMSVRGITFPVFNLRTPNREYPISAGTGSIIYDNLATDRRPRYYLESTEQNSIVLSYGTLNRDEQLSFEVLALKVAASEERTIVATDTANIVNVSVDGLITFPSETVRMWLDDVEVTSLETPYPTDGAPHKVTIQSTVEALAIKYLGRAFDQGNAPFGNPIFNIAVSDRQFFPVDDCAKVLNNSLDTTPKLNMWGGPLSFELDSGAKIPTSSTATTGNWYQVRVQHPKGLPSQTLRVRDGNNTYGWIGGTDTEETVFVFQALRYDLSIQVVNHGCLGTVHVELFEFNEAYIETETPSNWITCASTDGFIENYQPSLWIKGAPW